MSTTVNNSNQNLDDNSNVDDNSNIDNKKIRKCIVICNGPSVVFFNKFKVGKNLNDYDFIAVNRWNNIYKKLEIKQPPKHVVIGKNSLRENITNILRYRNTTIFHGIDGYRTRSKYKRLRFGNEKCYGKTINFLGSLWWSGVYAIQLALKLEYDEINVFGFTCSNAPDAWDRKGRAPIPKNNFNRICAFFDELERNNLLKEKINIYENKEGHPLSKYIHYKFT